MNAAYLQAAVPEPFTVLGKRLETFTLGHQLLLERFDCAFALGSKEDPNYADLIFATFVCSMRFQDAIAALSSRWLTLRLWIWGKLCGNFDVAEKMALFARYLKEQTQEPEYWIEKPGNGPASGIPFIQFLKTQIMSEFGMSEMDALNMPYAVAIWDFITQLENKGIVRVFTDEDKRAIEISKSKEAQDFLARLAADFEAKGLNKKNVNLNGLSKS